MAAGEYGKLVAWPHSSRHCHVELLVLPSGRVARHGVRPRRDCRGGAHLNQGLSRRGKHTFFVIGQAAVGLNRPSHFDSLMDSVSSVGFIGLSVDVRCPNYHLQALEAEAQAPG